MKKQLYILLLIPFCITLMGCPYKSQFPIDTSRQIEDKLLIGGWKDFSSIEKSYDIRFIKNSRFTILEKSRRSGNRTDEKMYFGTTSSITGTRFLNLYDTTKDDTGYYIYKIVALTATKLVLIPISEKNAPVFEKEGMLKNWLIQNKDLPNFYSLEDMKVFVRSF